MENLSKEELLEFEREIKDAYEAGKMRSPVHLVGGNETQLIKIFKNINPEDWVFSTHRSHYHALLKGVDKEWLKNEIFQNRSIHINNKEHKIFTSAIVGGNLSIALGVALALKRRGSKSRVWCFIGDMAAEMGVFHECAKYASGHDLPITFVIEDNGMSVNTPTKKVWGEKQNDSSNIIRYTYTRLYPHHGSGKWVTF